MKFKESDFKDIWDHSMARKISPSLVKEIVKVGNLVLKKAAEGGEVYVIKKNSISQKMLERIRGMEISGGVMVDEVD